jgi:hypothetical protein
MQKEPKIGGRTVREESISFLLGWEKKFLQRVVVFKQKIYPGIFN